MNFLPLVVERRYLLAVVAWLPRLRILSKVCFSGHIREETLMPSSLAQ